MIERRITQTFMAMASARSPRAFRIANGLVIGLAAVAVHVGLDRLWPGGARFALVMPAVLLSCLAFGRASAVTTLSTGFIGVWWLIMPSHAVPTMLTTGEIVSLAVFLVAGGTTIFVTEAYRAISRDLVRELDTKSLLINELNHRVKNTLATVQALAAQTFPRTDEPFGARAAFEGRLQALSRAHDVLTQTSWSHARMSQIIDGAVAPFDSQRFSIDGEDCALEPQKALALAMALHELGTNAMKYGALSNMVGTVEIVAGVKDGRRFLDWRERDGPEVEPRARKGFGSRLLERALAQEIDGKVSLEFPRSGVECRFSGF